MPLSLRGVKVMSCRTVANAVVNSQRSETRAAAVRHARARTTGVIISNTKRHTSPALGPQNSAYIVKIRREYLNTCAYTRALIAAKTIPSSLNSTISGLNAMMFQTSYGWHGSANCHRRMTARRANWLRHRLTP